MQRALSSEFPNDNDELHLGTIWMSEEPCGRVQARFSPRLEEDPPGVGDAEPIEIVESLPIEDPDEVVVPAIEIDLSLDEEPEVTRVSLPPPSESEIELSLEEEPEVRRVPVPLASEVVVSSDCAEAIASALDLTPAPLPADLLASLDSPDPDAQPAELLAAIEAADCDELRAGDPDSRTSARDGSDPFVAFLATLAATALATTGGTVSLDALEERFADDPVAVAWRAILRGESDDFSLCGTPLDEWAAGTLAVLLDAPSKVTQLRRELRTRGVAAFGLVEAA